MQGSISVRSSFLPAQAGITPPILAEAIARGLLCNCIDYRGTGILPVVHERESAPADAA